MKQNSRSNHIFTFALLLFVLQSCVAPGIDPSLPIWGVWNPGEKSEGPFRNVTTELGLFKSPTDNPIIILPRTDLGPSLAVQGQRLLIESVDGKFPEFLVKVKVYLAEDNAIGTLRLRFTGQDKLVVEKVVGDYDVLHTGSRFYTRAEKLSAPIDETEYHNGL